MSLLEPARGPGPRRTGALASLLGLLLAGCASGGMPEAYQGSASSLPEVTGPAAPGLEPSGEPAATVKPDCTVRVGAARIPLTLSQARAVTDVAAAASVAGQTATASAYTSALADTGLPQDRVPDVAPLLPRALSGRVAGALSCEVERKDVAEEPTASSGLAVSAERLRQRIYDRFGQLLMGGFAGGGGDDGPHE